jgi:hypothetical protein
MLGIIVGVALMMFILKKGREVMTPTITLKEPTVENKIGKLTLAQEKENPLIGFASDSNLTIDRFFSMTREDKNLE